VYLKRFEEDHEYTAEILHILNKEWKYISILMRYIKQNSTVNGDGVKGIVAYDAICTSEQKTLMYRKYLMSTSPES
jgi:hypothetical protein